MSLTVTTYPKYLKVTNGLDFTKYILYAGLISVDAIGNARVQFNAHDPQFQQFVRYNLVISEIDTFDTSGNFTAESIAAAIIAKVVA